jgi:hypothetical protein
MRDGEGKRMLIVGNSNYAPAATSITGFTSTPGMAWLTDPNRAYYQVFVNN